MRNFFISLFVFISPMMHAQSNIEHDDFETSKGKLSIYFIGHGTLMFDFNGTIIHVDPWSKLADYKTLPKADIILLTHGHGDHMDTSAIHAIWKPKTKMIVTAEIHKTLKDGIIMNNGDNQTLEKIKIEAVPAYNITAERDKFHPKGRDNGYVLTFGNKRVYIAGDTENIPEMSNLKKIDIAFLPMNQPYTMLPAQVAEAANRIKPKILYPYHFGDTDTNKLLELMKLYPEISVRVKNMK